MFRAKTVTGFGESANAGYRGCSAASGPRHFRVWTIDLTLAALVLQNDRRKDRGPPLWTVAAGQMPLRKEHQQIALPQTSGHLPVRQMRGFLIQARRTGVVARSPNETPDRLRRSAMQSEEQSRREQRKKLL